MTEIQFILEKCAKVIFKKGSKVVKSKNITLDMNIEIKKLEFDKHLGHLGINEAKGINHFINKEKIRKYSTGE